MNSLNVNLTTNDLFKVFASSSCVICLKHIGDNELFKCADCKSVFYCSKDHQVEHWPKHKEFCRLVKLNMAKEDVPAERYFMPVNGRNSKWSRGIYLIENMISNTPQPLTIEENCLLLFPYVCNVCFIYNKNRMIHCPGCRLIAYCSEEHMEQDKDMHTLYCWRYEPYLEYERCCAQRFLIAADIKCNLTSFPSDMTAFTEDSVDIKTFPYGREKCGLYFLSIIFSLPLTLIYSIEKSDILENKKKTSLTLYIIEPFTTENHAWWTWEYLFHYFEQLKTINLIFICFNTRLYFPRPVLKCRNCRLYKNIVFKVVYKEGCIDVPSQTNGELVKFVYERPDMIFNPSESFPLNFPSHQEAKRYIYQSFINIPNVVIVISSSTFDDAVTQHKMVINMCRKEAKFLLEISKNPYPPLICIPNWEQKSGNECMSNNYLTILKTS